MNDPPATGESRSDRVARHATAIGVGFLVLMPAWQVGLRLADLAWDGQLVPVIAMTSAITVSIVATLIVGRRLGRSNQRRP